MDETTEQLESTTVNNPDLSPSGKVRRKAITSSEQAYSIATHLERGNEERNKVDSVVLAKYNGAQPHSPAALKASAEDWRSNAPTGFLSSIVDRITPSPLQAIDSARYLTSASLASGNPEDEKKSEFFRQEVTKTIRGWNGWRDFLASLCQENVLMGRAAPLNLNPFSPWPKMFRGDEVFFDDGTGQHARMVACLSAKEDLLIHEFVDFIEEGREIAEHAGWDFDACIKKVNEALPKSPTSDSEGDGARKWEDAIREGNVGASHAGAKVIELYHVVAVEPDTKKVTHYIVSRSGNHELLFKKEDRFERMEDVTTLFALQPGNGKYYSSKGVGRIMLNLHISIERDRNNMLDHLHIAGLKIVTIETGATPSLQTRVTHPFMVVTSNGKFDVDGIETNVEAYIAADNQVSKWAEQLVGSYLPGLRSSDEEGGNITATEATIIANRDAQAKTAFLARFWGQFADLVSQITRRLCDPETADTSAKELQKKFKDPEQGNLTDEEIQKLANAPAAEVVMDLTQMHNEQIIRVFGTLVGNPMIDQDRLMARYLSAAVNPTFANDVLLDKQGIQANETEAVRQQMMETEALLAGAPGMPVSPRDIHADHLKTIFSDLKSGIPKIAQAPTPKILDDLNAQLVHSRAHIQMWKDQGAQPEELKQFEQAQKAFESVLEQLGSQMQQKMGQDAQNQAEMSSVDAASARPNAQGVSEQPPEAQNATTASVAHEILKSLDYNDAPPSIRRQLEKLAGLEPATNEEDFAWKEGREAEAEEVVAEPVAPALPEEPRMP